MTKRQILVEQGQIGSSRAKDIEAINKLFKPGDLINLYVIIYPNKMHQFARNTPCIFLCAKYKTCMKHLETPYECVEISVIDSNMKHQVYGLITQDMLIREV